MADDFRLIGPVSVANLTAAAGVSTTVDGWWPCLNLTWRTPVPPSITKITAQVRQRGVAGKTFPITETVMTAADLATGTAKIVNGVSMGQHLEVRLYPAGAPGLPFQPTPWVDVTTPWDALMAALDGLTVGCVKIVCGDGVPTRADLPPASLDVREDIPDLYQWHGAAGRVVQSKVAICPAVNNLTVTLDAAPTDGNALIAFAIGHGNGPPGPPTPAAGSGWTLQTSHHFSGGEGSYGLTWKVASGDGASVTPMTTSLTGYNYLVGVWEVADLPAGWAGTFEAVIEDRDATGANPVTTTAHSTADADTLVLIAASGNRNEVPTLDGAWTVDASDHSNANSSLIGLTLGHRDVAAAATSVGATVSWGGSLAGSSILTLFLAPRPAARRGWLPFSKLRTILLNGVAVETDPLSLNFVGAGLAAATNSAGQVTITLDDDLNALAALSSTGLMVRTGSGTVAARTLTAPAAGISVSNGSGASGNPTLALANDLAAIEALSGTNTIYYRSGVDTWSAVTIGSGLAFSAGTLSALGGSSYTADETTLHLTSTTFSIKAGGVGTTELANDAVTTAKISNSAVTLAKIANASNNSVVLGAGSGGAGATYTELSITAGTGISITNSAGGFTIEATGGGSGGGAGVDLFNHAFVGGI